VWLGGRKKEERVEEFLGGLSKSRHDASLAPTKSLGSFDGYPPGCGGKETLGGASKGGLVHEDRIWLFFCPA
jgi:hypothetical protein